MMAADFDPEQLNLSIPAYHISNRKFVTYEIQTSKDGVSWSVHRRYQEFANLHAAIKKALLAEHVATLPDLPPKTMRLGKSKFSEEYLNERRQLLERYMRRLVSLISPDKLETFDDFLEYAEHLLQATVRRLSVVPELQHLNKFLREAVRAASQEQHTRRNSSVTGASPKKVPAGGRLVFGGAGTISTAEADFSSGDEDDETESSGTRNTHEVMASPTSVGLVDRGLTAGDFLPSLQAVVQMFRDYAAVIHSNAEDTRERASAAATKVTILNVQIRGKEEEIADAKGMIESLRTARAKECEKERKALFMMSAHVRTVAGELIRVQHDLGLLKILISRHKEAADALRRLCSAWERSQFSRIKHAMATNLVGDTDASTISENRIDGGDGLNDLSIHETSFINTIVEGDDERDRSSSFLVPAPLDVAGPELHKLKGIVSRVEFMGQSEQLAHVARNVIGFVQDFPTTLHDLSQSRPNITTKDIKLSTRAPTSFPRIELPQEDTTLSGINENAALLMNNIAAENSSLHHLLQCINRGHLISRELLPQESVRTASTSQPAAATQPKANAVGARSAVTQAPPPPERSLLHSVVAASTRTAPAAPGRLNGVAPQPASFESDPGSVRDKYGSRRALPTVTEAAGSPPKDLYSPSGIMRSPTKPAPEHSLRSPSSPVVTGRGNPFGAEEAEDSRTGIPIHRTQSSRVDAFRSDTRHGGPSTAFGSLPDSRPMMATAPSGRGNPFEIAAPGRGGPAVVSSSLNPSGAGVLMSGDGQDVAPPAHKNRSLHRENTFSVSRPGKGNPF